MGQPAFDQAAADSIRALHAYAKPSLWKSSFQLLNTFVPFLLLWALMWFSLSYSYWLTLLLSVPTALFLVRLFIIQHDCGHGSFFRSRRANNTAGFLLGVLTLVPYDYWRKSHAIHHASHGDLERRGWGDIDTRTVKEYLALSPGRRRLYRILRSPVALLAKVACPIIKYFPAVVAVSRPVLAEVLCIVSVSNRSLLKVTTVTVALAMLWLAVL